MEKIKKLTINLSDRSYDIHIGKNILSLADEYFNLDRKVAIVTDSGVPEIYSKTIAALSKEAKIITFPKGEKNKNINTYAFILEQMLDFGLQRKDAVIAVGGGVCGDMAGFAASTFMRGIDFYNVPTTLLSQVDSSIGGKTAIDFCNVKNIVGSFYQPKGVLIDTEVLKTLDKRQFSQGLAEVVKMSLTSDKKLFEALEDGLWKENIDEVIARALKIKKDVVEKDERESSLRKVLNFGHTFGHGIESLGELYHGECVALGMIPMSSKEVQKRLIPLLEKMDLPTSFNTDLNKAFDFMLHDKKGDGEKTSVIFVDSIGNFRMENIPFFDLCEHIKNNIL